MRMLGRASGFLRSQDVGVGHLGGGGQDNENDDGWFFPAEVYGKVFREMSGSMDGWSIPAKRYGNDARFAGTTAEQSRGTSARDKLWELRCTANFSQAKWGRLFAALHSTVENIAGEF